MHVPRIPVSRWFLYGATSLMVFLCLAVLLAGLLLTYRSYQPRLGEVAGNSMEPTLQGPRYLVTCGSCQTVIPFTVDAWNSRRPAICLCCGHSINSDDELPVQRGETIYYLPPQRLRRTSRSANSEKIQRGDIVVLERKNGSQKELKRVVGLPNEKITLKEGDLWINDQRYEKTLRETLSQSVLVAAWDPRFCDRRLDEFLESLTLPPTNELAINSHDSHLPIPTYDIGIAIRSIEPIQKGRLALTLADSSHHYDIDLSFNNNWSITCNGLPVPRLSISPLQNGESPKWIIVALIDGRILIGNEAGGCFARSLASLRSTRLHDSEAEIPVQIRFMTASDTPEIDMALVFRDLVYRGYGDTADETIPEGPGYVLLGDNVSISDDSRGPAGSSVRWEVDRIKGVVLRDSNELILLLRQTEIFRFCNCQENWVGLP